MRLAALGEKVAATSFSGANLNSELLLLGWSRRKKEVVVVPTVVLLLLVYVAVVINVLSLATWEMVTSRRDAAVGGDGDGGGRMVELLRETKVWRMQVVAEDDGLEEKRGLRRGIVKMTTGLEEIKREEEAKTETGEGKSTEARSEPKEIWETGKNEDTREEKAIESQDSTEPSMTSEAEAMNIISNISKNEDSGEEKTEESQNSSTMNIISNTSKNEESQNSLEPNTISAEEAMNIIEDMSKNRTNLCQIGGIEEEWTLKNMRDHFQLFTATVFVKGGVMTIDNNADGVGLFHGWFLSYVIGKIQPEVIIENGAFRGRVTWLIRQVAPFARIIVVSPKEPTTYRDRNHTSVYFTGEKYIDFAKIDFDSLDIDKNKTLVIFSDHMAGERRIREARKLGFRHLIVDDNYLPGCKFNCDNFSAKQACDAKDRSLWNILPESKQDDYFYDDFFSKKARRSLSISDMGEIYQNFMSIVDIYFEAPPVYYVPSRFGIPQSVYDSFTKAPLFHDREELGRHYGRQFNGHHEYFWNMAYIRLREDPSLQKPRLRNVVQIPSTLLLPEAETDEDELLLEHEATLPKENFEFSESRQILFVFNGNYDAEAQNLLKSIRKAAPYLLKDVIVCVSDQSGARFVLKNKLRSFTMSAITETGVWHSPNQNRFVARKLEAIIYLLERGMKVLYADTDIVFLKDPMAFAPDASKGYSISMQDESREKWDVTLLCTGFIFADPTEDAMWVFKTALDVLVSSGYAFGDQDALNRIQNSHMYGDKFSDITQVLDPCLFPNGIRYFREDTPRCLANEAMIVHANWIIGVEEKIMTMKRYNLWFVN